MPEVIPVATGEKWIGCGVRSFQSIIHELISEASNELVMTVYVLTNMNIVNDLRKALERGIGVEIYLYSGEIYEENDALKAILEFESEYNYLKIHRIKEDVLHAKVLVVDGAKVLSGSANFTINGMINNYELGFLVNDSEIAMKILTLVKRLTPK